MDNLIGKTLDGLYTIQELIGAGGMANVYKAVVSAPGGPVPEGTVVAVKPAAGDQIVEIRFEKVGIKKTMANFAPLTKITEE